MAITGLILVAFLLHIMVQVRGLDLAQPAYNVLRKYDTRFAISPENLMSQLQVLNNNQYSLQQNMMTQISKEIAVLADSEATFRHNTWTFQISQNYATLDYIMINVDINEKRDAHITGGIVRLTQNVPQQYDIVQHCARTGGRRYGLFGPRDMECSWHHVARGLHQHEINHVIAHLNSHMPAAQKLIK
jgi:hypothetical protein